MGSQSEVYLTHYKIEHKVKYFVLNNQLLPMFIAPDNSGSNVFVQQDSIA
jgi:hypothetical protein